MLWIYLFKREGREVGRIHLVGGTLNPTQRQQIAYAFFRQREQESFAPIVHRATLYKPALLPANTQKSAFAYRLAGDDELRASAISLDESATSMDASLSMECDSQWNPESYWAAQGDTLAISYDDDRFVEVFTAQRPAPDLHLTLKEIENTGVRLSGIVERLDDDRLQAQLPLLANNLMLLKSTLQAENALAEMMVATSTNLKRQTQSLRAIATGPLHSELNAALDSTDELVQQAIKLRFDHVDLKMVKPEPETVRTIVSVITKIREMVNLNEQLESSPFNPSLAIIDNSIRQVLPKGEKNLLQNARDNNNEDSWEQLKASLIKSSMQQNVPEPAVKALQRSNSFAGRRPSMRERSMSFLSKRGRSSSQPLGLQQAESFDTRITRLSGIVSTQHNSIAEQEELIKLQKEKEQLLDDARAILNAKKPMKRIERNIESPAAYLALLLLWRAEGFVFSPNYTLSLTPNVTTGTNTSDDALVSHVYKQKKLTAVARSANNLLLDTRTVLRQKFQTVINAYVNNGWALNNDLEPVTNIAGKYGAWIANGVNTQFFCHHATKGPCTRGKRLQALANKNLDFSVYCQGFKLDKIRRKCQRFELALAATAKHYNAWPKNKSQAKNTATATSHLSVRFGAR